MSNGLLQGWRKLPLFRHSVMASQFQAGPRAIRAKATLPCGLLLL